MSPLASEQTVGKFTGKRETGTKEEVSIQDALTEALLSDIIPFEEKKGNLPVFMSRQALAKLLGIYHLYQQFLPVTGSIFDFGTRWGHNLALFANLRGILEPYHYFRKIVGFDTFSGFPDVHEKDGAGQVIKPGSFNVSKGYAQFLDGIMHLHEQNAPISHVKKYEVVEGNVLETLSKYLKENPHTIIACAYFDFDIYEPTAEALKLILPRCTKGTVLGFDEINNKSYPGETMALMEEVGLGKYSLKKNPFYVCSNYLVIE